MRSSKLTDEELLELAKLCDEDSDEEMWDIAYYQETFNIQNGEFKILITHLYSHYTKWSISPVKMEEFCKLLRIEKKTEEAVYMNRELCTIDISKVIGEYVREQKKNEKEERLRKISGIKPKA